MFRKTLQSFEERREFEKNKKISVIIQVKEICRDVGGMKKIMSPNILQENIIKIPYRRD